MRINWGTGIVLAFIGFIGFILFFVIRMNTDKKYDHHLVTEEYYEKELKYQDDIDKLKNGKALKENVSYTRTEDGLLVRFPQAFDVKDINGKVFLYRPSNEHLDF